ncbi:Abi family protein [Brevibacillus brevis]|uniref:Abi family protein n=1 Tax=Brevibacillus brevis TaxID=1393 RepID=UPI00165E7ACA|nr:Abi family protein [Brevibacillus brevis]
MTNVTVELKPPTTFEEQLNILRTRGVVIPDEKYSISILKRINYYRFTAYALHFKENDTYFPNTTFNKIYRHYEFDAKLRQHLMKMVEHVEISFRTHIAYTLAHSYGAEGYKSESTFFNPNWCQDFNTELRKCIDKSKDPFVLHHLSKYSGRFPVWVAIEVLTFSWLSKLFKNLRNKDKKEISRYYGVHFNEISNWLHALTIIRNKCAHYSRLFNDKLPMIVKFREDDKKHEIKNNLLYAMIFNLQHLILDSLSWNVWVIELESIVDEYNDVDIKLLGFHEQWREQLRKQG